MIAITYFFAGHSDWRLPNVTGLARLIENGHDDPALPSGCPFLNMDVILNPGSNTSVWSGTTSFCSANAAWLVKIGFHEI
jgi:hypothetical protein